MPLTSARRYARGRGNSRWHRVRSGVQFQGHEGRAGHVSLHYWCGVTGFDSYDNDRLWTVDELPPGEAACGTCVGRALGAKQDEAPADLPPLVFDPRWQTPPKWCPGSRSSRLWSHVAASVGRCLVCGEYAAVRAMGGPYDPRTALVAHFPGPEMVAPCPFDAWMRLTVRDGQVACACGWPYVLERAAVAG